MTLLGSRNATGADFKRVIELLEAGAVEIKPWITHRVACDQMAEQFPHWLGAQAGFIKAIVEF